MKNQQVPVRGKIYDFKIGDMIQYIPLKILFIVTGNITTKEKPVGPGLNLVREVILIKSSSAHFPPYEIAELDYDLFEECTLYIKA